MEARRPIPPFINSGISRRNMYSLLSTDAESFMPFHSAYHVRKRLQRRSTVAFLGLRHARSVFPGFRCMT